MVKSSRWFSLVSYLEKDEILSVCKRHLPSIRGFAFINHCYDENEPHFHVLIHTYSSWSCASINKWFILDERNTFCEVANDPLSLKEYITHSDQKSRADGKHLYSSSDVYDYGFFGSIPRTNSFDNSLEILDKMILGIDPRTLVRQYGRDFVYHYRNYVDLVDACRNFSGCLELKNKVLEDSVNYEFSVNNKKNT